MEEEKMKLDIEKMKEINGGANKVKDRGGGNTGAPNKKADANRVGLSTIKENPGGNA